MAAVARALLRVEDARELRRKAVALPVREAARERDDVLVPELLECLRRKGRPVAGLAVEDDRPGAIGRGALDTRLEISARDVDSPGKMALVPLVLFAHVDEERRVDRVEEVAGARSVHLLDLGLDLLQKLAVARHDYPKYSGIAGG